VEIEVFNICRASIK